MPEVIKILNQRISHLSLRSLMTLSLESISIGILWIFTFSAIIGISIGYTDWFVPKTPLNLLLGFILLVVNTPIVSHKGAIVFAICFLIGMGVEIVGVHTGAIFGDYYYGGNLGFQILDVPLMIGVYWAVLVIVTNQMIRKLSDNLLAVALGGAFLMVGLDCLMEQLAGPLDFWHFAGGMAGLKNYVAWFIVAFVLQIIAHRLIPRGGSRFSTHLYANQVVFFLACFLILIQF